MPTIRAALVRAAMALLAVLGVPSAAFAEGAAENNAPEIFVFIGRSGVATLPDGTPNGTVLRWAELVGDRSGLHLSLRVLDYGRSLPQVQQRADACSLGIVRLPEREERFDWIAPLWNDRLILVGFRLDTVVGGLEEADRVADGAIAATDGAMSALLAARGVRFKRVPDHTVGLRLVADGKMRFALSSRLMLNGPDPSVANLKEVADIDGIVGWLACGLSMPQGLRDRLRDAHVSLARAPEFTPILAAMTAPGLTPALHRHPE